ncbi:lantibiotic dehydratase [Streptomyces sp. NPDC002668]|uniref:lantibiotic dehydratase n=1 Tax=Streptomyces sp. NPDC002668 TaxID=3154422 RepID=UPI0033285E05
MSDDELPIFESGGVFLLRVPVLPNEAAGGEQTDTDTVMALARDPLAAEALLVSSPSLARAVQDILAGSRPPVPAGPRLTRSLLRYHLRMSRRATPFGLLAGVAVGSFGDKPRARLTGRRTKLVQPDRAWLGTLLDARDATDPPAALRVVVNNTCRTQGDQLLLPLAMRSPKPARRSVRRTPPVEAVLRRAQRPVAFGDLVTAVTADCPGLATEQAAGLLTRLIALEFLVTDSLPPPAEPDPLGHVARTAPAHTGLRNYGARLRHYASRDVGRGAPALAELYQAAGSPQCVQVDLALEAHVRLPAEVAGEVASAASVLWRVSVPESGGLRALTAYHREFLEHYGLGELVPVSSLLDPDTGLGPPAGYELPAGHRRPLPAVVDPDRASVLNALYAGALTAGRTSVELDVSTIRSLKSRRGDPPPSAELFVSVLAESFGELAAGRFLLMVPPFRVSRPAGTAWGRFSQLLGAEEHLAAFARRTWGAGSGTPLPVRVDYATRDRRLLNVTGAPDIAAHHVAVGVYADRASPGAVDLAHVCVYADTQRFHVVDSTSGREISPFAPHMVNSRLAPNVARFLLEVPLMGTTQLGAWDWGHLTSCPFLPAVRYGRTILSPATWRLCLADLADGEAAERLVAWRERWRVPDRIHLVSADQRLALDLRLPRHRELLCHQVLSDRECVLHEDLSLEPPLGWLRGPGGMYDAEIVVPLFARSSVVREPVAPAPTRTRLSAPHPPGGEWLSARIPSSAEGQRLILAAHLEPWLRSQAAHVDRWFFVRYADASTGRPHLRIRLHGDPSAVARYVLPSLRDWVQDLAAAGLADDLSLHVYRPEVERYGGIAAIEAAERFFCADSRLALRRLDDDTDPLPVAADVVRLIRGFQMAGAVPWEQWLINHYEKDETRHRVFAGRRREALALIPVDGPAPSAEDAQWHVSLAAYAATVRRAAERENWILPAEILKALLHMHCNRRLRFGADTEQDVYAVARGAAVAHLDRSNALARLPDSSSPG